MVLSGFPSPLLGPWGWPGVSPGEGSGIFLGGRTRPVDIEAFITVVFTAARVAEAVTSPSPTLHSDLYSGLQ